MLRLLVLVLLLANALYFAWTQGLLASYGLAPASQAEPQRLAQQLRPEAMQLMEAGDAPPADTVTTGAAALPAPTAECLQAGPFTEAQASALRPRLQTGLPTGSWSLESRVEPERWIVHMGPYPDEEAVAKKREELRQLGVAFEALLDPALGPGLSLGHFGSRADADRALASAAQRGVRTAKVVLERPETRGLRLTLAAVDTTLRARLDALALPLQGKALQACR